MKKFAKIALGGTFDRLHAGHRVLIETAVVNGDELVIGLTSDEYVSNKLLSELIEPFATRKKYLHNYINSLFPQASFEIIALDDVFGTTLSDREIEAVCVSEQTVEGAELINLERVKIGLKKIPVVVAQMIRDDDGEYISSSNIRSGKISREGRCYSRVFDRRLALNDKLKNKLKVIQGELVEIDQISDLRVKFGAKICVVGDQCMINFLKKHLGYDVGVVDGKIMREKHNFDFDFGDRNILKVDNPASVITRAMVNKLVMALKSPTVVMVSGEEDLAALVLLLLSPLESLIFYGQPGEGMVMMAVTEANKEKWHEILAKEC